MSSLLGPPISDIPGLRRIFRRNLPMRLEAVCSFLLAMVLSSCVQLGKYSSVGSYSVLLRPEFGIISVDQGTRAFRSSDPVENLLAVIFLSPGVHAHPPTGGSATYGPFATTHWFYWTFGDERVTFDYRWNRLSDRVTIMGQHFDRTRGNGFVVRRNTGGSWSVEQMSDLPRFEGALGLLRFFRSRGAVIGAIGVSSNNWEGIGVSANY